MRQVSQDQGGQPGLDRPIQERVEISVSYTGKDHPPLSLSQGRFKSQGRIEDGLLGKSQGLPAAGSARLPFLSLSLFMDCPRVRFLLVDCLALLRV